MADGYDDERNSNSKQIHFSSVSSVTPESPSNLSSYVDEKPQVSRSGFLNNASHFVMINPNIYDIANVHYDNGSITVLEKLSNHIIYGIEFDSSTRDPPPRCHPGTRTVVIDRIQKWFNNGQRSKNLLWLSGPAGVGKSALVQSLAECFSESKHLGAALFFSRLSRRNDPQRVFITIAFQLAIRIPSYLAFISGEMATNPNLLYKNMGEQFKRLITEPFAHRRICQGDLARVILLDGLDECEGENLQCEIIQLISTFVVRFPSVPFLWIIASRAERKLRATFSLGNIRGSLWQEYLPIDSTEACQGVEHFLRNEFERIRKDYSFATPPGSRWPAEIDILRISKAASGLFIYASVVIRFIEDSNIADPVSQLETILSIIDNISLSESLLQEHPFALLDALYSQILSRIPRPVLSVARRLLGHLLMVRHISCRSPVMDIRYGGCQPSLLSVSNILGLKQNVVYGALQKLHSVLDIPPLEFANAKFIQILHASFADYLEDRTRSLGFAIDLTEAVGDACRCYFRILRQVSLSPHLPPSLMSLKNITLSWPLPKSSVEAQKWETSLLQHLYYQARYEFVHLLTRGHENWSTASDPFVSLGESECLEILAQLDFSKLGDVFFRSNTDSDLESFMDWIFSLWENSAPELEFRGIIKEIRLQDLDLLTIITKAGVAPWVLDQKYYSGCQPGGPRFEHRLRRPRSSDSLVQLLSDLQEQQADRPQTRVLICGRSKSRKGILFVIEFPQEGTNLGASMAEKEYYFFPYSVYTSG